MTLLGWEILVFVIPLGVGALLALGAALGVLEAGDAEAQVDDGGDHEQHGSGLEVGRLPLSIRLMLVSLPFGSLGLAATYLLGGLGQGPGVRTAIALAVAAAGSWWAARGLGRLLRQRVRMLESETITRRELVGGVGRAVLAVGSSAGLAQVRDRRGNLHQVSCRTLEAEAPLPAGSEVLVVDYDEAGKLYYVSSNPAAR